MSKIEMGTKRIIHIDDWDELVSTTYGKVYDFQQQDDCRDMGLFEFTVNDDGIDVEDPYKGQTVPDEINGEKMGVDFDIWLKRDPKEWNGDEEDRPFVDMFWERNFYPDINVLANDLFKRGLIPVSGLFSIKIYW